MIAQFNLLSGPWQPFFAKEIIWTAVAVTAGLWAWVYVHGFRTRPILKGAMLAMRLAVVVLLGYLLMGPSKLKQSKVTVDRPNISILVDTSESMETEDMDGKSRLAVAREDWLNAQTLDKLSGVATCSIYGFDTQLKSLPASVRAGPVSDWKTGRFTNLSGSLNRLITTMPRDKTHAILLISDGHDTTLKPMSSVAKLARNRNIPIHCVPIGKQGLQTDVSIYAIAGQEYLLKGETGSIEVQIFQMGANNRKVDLTVSCGNWKHEQVIAFERRASVSVQIPIKHDTPGVFPYAIDVKPLKEEKDTFNNAQELLVPVSGGKLKMLLVEGQPYWESKFIADSIRKDEGLQLTQLVQTTSKKLEKIVTRNVKHQAEVPQTASEWAKFDVVILGRHIERLVNEKQAEALIDSINDLGVQVVLARGRPYDSGNKAMSRIFSTIEPVHFSDNVLLECACELTDLGISHPTFYYINSQEPVASLIRQMPPLLTLHAVNDVKAGVSILAQTMPRGQQGGSGSPVITTMSYGRGRVLSILGEGMWQWKIIGSRKKELKDVYDRYWSNTVRWLAMGTGFKPGEAVSLQLSHQTVEKGNPLTVFARTRSSQQPELTVTMEGPAKDVQTISLERDGDRYLTAIEPQLLGVHTITLNAVVNGKPISPQVKRFNVYDNNIELRQTNAQPDVLKSLAAFTGGRILHASPDGLIESLKRRQLEKLVPDRLEYRWDHWFLMALLLSWVGTEWLVRKKGGLL